MKGRPVPGAAAGFSPVAQPFAVATLTSGIGLLLGSGRVGLGPKALATGSRAVAPQAITDEAMKAPPSVRTEKA